MHSRPNCSSKVISVTLGAVLRVAEPFTSKYNCSIVHSPGTPGPRCLSLFVSCRISLRSNSVECLIITRVAPARLIMSEINKAIKNLDYFVTYLIRLVL